MVLIVWCWIAAVVLLVSLAAHASTFLGIDPIKEWPGVMFIHIAIFPPFIAALYYAQRIGGKDEKHQDRVFHSAPLGLRILTGVFFAYAFVNFTAFLILNEGGGPHERDGKYVLQSHGTILREISEEEFHQQQAYVVRGFSGHWMLFTSASLTLLVGAAKLRPRRVPKVETVEPAETELEKEPPPEPTTPRAGLVALVLYVACLALIFSDQPALAVAVVLPVTVGAVLAFRRRRGFPHRPFESCIGCLLVFPNGLIASRLGYLVAEFIYLAIYVNLGTALSHDVAVTFPREGPSQLSNGDLLDNHLWSALMLFVQFPLFAIGTIGLTYLAEHVGRLIEVRRRKENSGPHL